MSVSPTLVVCLLVLTPLAAGIGSPPPVAVDPVAFDPDDATLMLLLARLDEPTIQSLPLPVPSPGDSLPAALARLGVRAHAPLAAEDVAPFARLDPRVSAPLLTLVVAVERAWDLTDAAFAALSPEERVELGGLVLAQEEGSPRFVELTGGVDKRTLLEGAIMLTDTVESLVVPQLQEAVRQGAWPANAVADPRGVIRLGGAGNDVESLDRIIQIDPSGDDVYTNNAGGTTMLDPVFDGVTGPWNILTPIAISIDFDGDDVYDTPRLTASQGASTFDGFGLLLDYAGGDYYYGRSGIANGLGVLRDHAGNDEYRAGGQGSGTPLAVLRDDAGNDIFRMVGSSNGYSQVPGMIGLLWDRAGIDEYRTQGGPGWDMLGWGNSGGRGWFVDEGPEVDDYETANWPTEPIKHGCNDCTWERGSGALDEGPGGKGNDNSGGLAYLLGYQDPLVRQVGS